MRASWFAELCVATLCLAACDSRASDRESRVRLPSSQKIALQSPDPQSDWPRTDNQVKALLAKADERGGGLTAQEVAKLEFAAFQEALLAYFALYLHHSMDGDPSQQDKWFLEGARRGEPNLLVGIADRQKAKAVDASPANRVDLLLRAKRNYETALESKATLSASQPSRVRQDVSEIDAWLEEHRAAP